VPVKPYNGTTSWKSFRDHFNRICTVNKWESKAEKLQHLTISLEGTAAEILKDINEADAEAWDKIWDALERRFGSFDDAQEAMRKFDACRQLDDQSIPEFEHKLRPASCTAKRGLMPRINSGRVTLKESLRTVCCSKT